VLTAIEKQNFKAIGANVRKHRVANNMSQAQLAFEVSTTLRQIQRIESGTANCGFIYYCRIAEVLSITVADLLK
jgi:transcriptional regulator with XRE-family HTH domain